MNPTMERPNVGGMRRRHDLDWVRVLVVIFILPLIHTLRLFDIDPYRIKNEETTILASLVLGVFDQFYIPVLFLVSGAAVWYSLQQRTKEQFAYSRLIRLGIPLFTAIFTVTLLLNYYEALHNNDFTGNIFAFFAYTFTTEGVTHLGQGHLWFVTYLLLYSVVLLPFMEWSRSEAGHAFIDWIASFMTKWWGIWLPGLWFIGTELALRWIFPENRGAILYDWANLVFWGSFFLVGFIAYQDERFTTALKRNWAPGLLIGVLGYALFVVTHTEIIASVQEEATVAYILRWIGRGASAWGFTIAMMGFAAKYLQRESRFIQAANDVILPYYILHFVPLAPLAFYIVPLDWGILPKLMVIFIGAIVGTLALCWYAVRPFNILRVLYGMRPLPRPASQETREQPSALSEPQHS